MRLLELQANKDRLTFTAAEIADAVAKVKKTQVFKDVTKLLPYEETSGRLKNGTLVFDHAFVNHKRPNKWTLGDEWQLIQTPITIYASGKISAGQNPLHAEIPFGVREITRPLKCKQLSFSYRADHFSFKNLTKLVSGLESISINAKIIKSHALQLLKVPEATIWNFSDTDAGVILEPYLRRPVGERNLLACQEELLDAGLDELAQL